MSSDPTFKMIAQEVFSIKGRGTVVSGQVESGTVSVGDEIRIQGKDSTRTALVSGVEVNRKVATRAQKGDLAGLLFKELSGEDVHKGDVLGGSDMDFTWKR